MSSRPAPWLFVAATCGALIGVSTDLAPGGPALIAALALVVTAIVAALVARGGRMFASAIAFMALGACGGFDAVHAWSDRVGAIPEGIVVVEAHVDEVSPGSPSRRMAVHVDAIVGHATHGAAQERTEQLRPWPARVDVVVLAPAMASLPRTGDRVRIRGVVRAPTPADGPGMMDGARLFLSRGLHGRIVVDDPGDLAVMERGAAPLWARVRDGLRERLLSLVTPREAGVLLALLVGDTSLFEDTQRAAYRAVGAGHLLAVSGMQVTLLAVLVEKVAAALLMLSAVGRRGGGARGAALVALVVVWSFVAVCGAPPSAVRAAVMASAVVSGRASGRRVALLDALGVAGCATVLVDPLVVVDAGFLLSYAAVFGLALSSMRSAPPLLDDDGRLWTKVRPALFASLAASAFTMPLSAWLFSEAAPSGLVANIVLVPVASILQLPALLAGAVGAWTGIAALCAFGAQAALLLEALVFGLAQRLPGTTPIVGPSGAWTAAMLAVAAAVVVAVALERRMRALGAAIVGVVLVVAARHEATALRMTVLPVGQGDGIVLELPDGTVFVVDGGGIPTFGDAHAPAPFDPGADVVVPFLRRRGIDHVDVMVVSHPHPDHALGLRAVVDALPVAQLWHDGATPGALMRPLLERVADARSTPRLLGMHRFGDTTVEVLAPAPVEGGATYPELGANDNSLVLRVCFASRCVLLPGDIEHFGEDLLVASSKDRVRADIVKVPHHGSRTSSTAGFVAATGAHDVILTTGRDNRFGFPNDDVVRRWTQAGARAWDTARHGEIEVRIEGDGDVIVHPWIETPPLTARD